VSTTLRRLCLGGEMRQFVEWFFPVTPDADFIERRSRSPDAIYRIVVFAFEMCRSSRLSAREFF